MTSGVLAPATRDPEGFVAGMGRPLVIDEAQRTPGLILAVKATFDRDRDPGSFVLTERGTRSADWPATWVFPPRPCADT